MAYAFTLWVCYVLLKEYGKVESMRLEFLATEKRRPDQFTVNLFFNLTYFLSNYFLLLLGCILWFSPVYFYYTLFSFDMKQWNSDFRFYVLEMVLYIVDLNFRFNSSLHLVFFFSFFFGGVHITGANLLFFIITELIVSINKQSNDDFFFLASIGMKGVLYEIERRT